MSGLSKWADVSRVFTGHQSITYQTYRHRNILRLSVNLLMNLWHHVYFVTIKPKYLFLTVAGYLLFSLMLMFHISLFLDMNSRHCLENWVWTFSRVCLSHMRNVAGDGVGQMSSQQEENVWNVQVRGITWVEHAGGRTWCMKSAAEIPCFYLQHINTYIAKSSPYVIVFPSWQRCQLLLSGCHLFFILTYLYSLVVFFQFHVHRVLETPSTRPLAHCESCEFNYLHLTRHCSEADPEIH